MRTLVLPLVLAAFSVAFAVSSDAATVKVLASVKAGSISGADADDDLHEFYLGSGADSHLVDGTVTAEDLAGVDLFVVMLPDDAFTAAEMTALGDFVAGGGTLLLMGEQHGFAAAENVYLNDLLTALGSAMRIGTSSVDSGFRDTLPGQIIAQPGLTDGVFVINYGNVNVLTGVDPARRIFLTSNLASVWGGFEPHGDGRIVFLADVNVISNLEETTANDNHVFFGNLIDLSPQATTVKILTSIKAGEIVDGDADNDLDAFYRGAGVSSSLWSGGVSAEALEGATLLVVMVPDDAFTTAELAAMADFLAADNRILFMGDQHGFSPAENAHINAALAALGSGMSLGTFSVDTEGLQDTIAGQILAHPFNTDVAVLNYGNVNVVLGIPAAADLSGPLFVAKDLVTPWGGVEELPGGGLVILLGDTNLLSAIENEAGNDNHVFFLNILAAPPAADVPPIWAGFAISAAPNPFNPAVTIRWHLPRQGDLDLRIYDLAGRLVRVLYSGPAPAGPGDRVWRGDDEAGRAVGAGVYLGRAEALGGARSFKLALVR